jgi:hypothetical protein
VAPPPPRAPAAAAAGGAAYDLDGRCRDGGGSLISGAGGESGILTGTDSARSSPDVSIWTTSTSQSTQSCVAVRHVVGDGVTPQRETEWIQDAK